jgi:hypothetical protein
MPTKKEQAIAIYREMSKSGTPARDDVVNRYMSDLDMTKAGATTYHRTAMKIVLDGNDPTVSVRTPSSNDHQPAQGSPSKLFRDGGTDKRDVFSVVYKGNDDSVTHMSSHFSKPAADAEKDAAKNTCKVIKGIGNKDDVDELIYSKLK